MRALGFESHDASRDVVSPQLGMGYKPCMHGGRNGRVGFGALVLAGLAAACGGAKDSVEKGNSGFFRLSHRFLKEKARLDGRDGDTIGWEFHHDKLSSRSEVARKFGKSG